MFMGAFYVFGFIPITFWTIANRSYYVGEENYEQLWSLVEESEDELTWEEGILFHYLSAPIFRWSNVQDFWCADVCLEGEKEFFQELYKPYGNVAILYTFLLDLFQLIPLSFVAYPASIWWLFNALFYQLFEVVNLLIVSQTDVTMSEYGEPISTEIY